MPFTEPMPGPLQAVAISGSPSGTSKSRRLLGAAEDALARAGVAVTWVDLATLPADDLLGRSRTGALDEAVAAVGRPHIVVVGTPVYRASYSGLLKVFFDLLEPGSLAGKVAIPIATGGGAAHQLVIDHALRPLLGSLGALVVATGVYGTEPQFDASATPHPLLLERVRRAVDEAVLIAGARAASASPSLHS